MEIIIALYMSETKKKCPELIQVDPCPNTKSQRCLKIV